MNITRILCPIDFSDASKHAIEQTIVVAGYYKSGVTALHVLTPYTLAVPGFVSSSEEERELDRLGRLAAEEFAAASARGIDLRVLVDVGQPAAAILDRASGLPADLIVMGTHGTSGFQRFVLGSITERVLRKASCPAAALSARTSRYSSGRDRGGRRATRQL